MRENFDLSDTEENKNISEISIKLKRNIKEI